MKTMDWIYRLCRWMLGGLFIYAGGTKLLEPKIFTVLIEAYGIVPEGLLMMVGVFFIYGWRRYRAIRPAGVRVIVNQLINKRRKEDAYG